MSDRAIELTEDEREAMNNAAERHAITQPWMEHGWLSAKAYYADQVEKALAESREAIRVAFEADPDNLVPYEQTVRAQEERAEKAESALAACEQRVRELAGGAE